MKIRFMYPEEKKQVIELAKQFKATEALGFLWTRWGNWERHPPVVAVEKGKIVGLQAAVFSLRRGYVNSYYRAIFANLHGKGIARKMMTFVLNRADEMGIYRFKVKANKDGLGARFWKNINAKPFATSKNGVELIYDLDIKQCRTIEEWEQSLKQPEQLLPIPKKEMNKYKKQGVILL